MGKGGHNHTAAYADGNAEYIKNGQHAHAGHQPGHHEISYRTYSHAAKCIDLLCHPHSPDFRCNSSPYATGQYYAAKHGSQFPSDTDSHNTANRKIGTVLRQFSRNLYRKNHACEQEGQSHDGK